MKQILKQIGIIMVGIVGIALGFVFSALGIIVTLVIGLSIINLIF